MRGTNALDVGKIEVRGRAGILDAIAFEKDHVFIGGESDSDMEGGKRGGGLFALGLSVGTLGRVPTGTPAAFDEVYFLRAGAGAAGKTRSQSVLTLAGAQSSDARLDDRPEELYDQAMTADRCKGTCSAHDRLPYWAEGILTRVYEQGWDAAPRNAAHPLATRQAHREHDRDAQALAGEMKTMMARIAMVIWGGNSAWRYSP